MKKVAKWVVRLKARVFGTDRTLITRSRRRLVASCIGLIGAFLFAIGSAEAVPIEHGDILVADYGANQLIRVDGKTGVRSVVSDFSNSSQGPVNGPNPSLSGVAIGHGQIFVTDRYVGIFRIDPHTGKRTLVSNFHQSNDGFVGQGLAVDAFGKVVATVDPGASFQPPYGSVVRVDPATDTRVVVTNLDNPAQGDALYDSYITDLALTHPGGPFIIGTATFVLKNIRQGAIYRVDPFTGQRTLLSDFLDTNQGADVVDLHFAVGIAVEHTGTILVNSTGNGIKDLLLRINPQTGNRTVVSDFTNPAQGPLGTAPQGAAVQDARHVFVGAYATNAGKDDLFRVNTQTGKRIVFSDSADPTQGPPFNSIAYIAVVKRDAGFWFPPANALTSPFGSGK